MEAAVLEFKENELYQEIDILIDGNKVGEAEIEIKSKMLSKFEIFEPYQNQGYGKQIVDALVKKYGCNNLWVNADNPRAIHVYEKCGFRLHEPTMFMMYREEKNDGMRAE